jgi:uncharacterized membrane protein YhaH (DUF805 family)
MLLARFTAGLSRMVKALASEKHWLVQRVFIVLIVAAVVITMLVVANQQDVNVYNNIIGSGGQ